MRSTEGRTLMLGVRSVLLDVHSDYLDHGDKLLADVILEEIQKLTQLINNQNFWKATG